MTLSLWHRDALRDEAQRPDEHLDLARAALLISCEAYPGLDVSIYLRRLDEMARRLEQMLRPGAGSYEIIGALNHYLFDELQFTSNNQEYYRPENSYLSHVLDYGTGIPITLSVVYMEIASRINFPLYGVGLPGHFIVKHISPDGEEILIDPFHGGSVLSEEDCEEQVRRTSGAKVTLHPHHLGTVTKRQILLRMLANLKNAYLRKQDYEHALSAIDLSLVIAPWNLDDIRDRGLVHYQLRQYDHALADLETYVTFNSDAADTPRINVAMEFLRAMRQAS